MRILSVSLNYYLIVFRRFVNIVWGINSIYNTDIEDAVVKILFLDFIYPQGHQRVSKNIIKCLSELSEVCVLTQVDYYRDFEAELSGMDIVEQPELEMKKGRLQSRLFALKNMMQSAKFIKTKEWDYLFVASFETISFMLGKSLFKELNKMFLVHHNNTDELKNKVKLNFFKGYMNKVNHIVLESFIKDYLVDVGVENNKIHVLPHPLNTNEKVSNEKYFCVGLSNSNDEQLIEQIIKNERESDVFLKLKRKVILKSKVNEFDNGFLKVVKGYIGKDVYDDYITNCKYIFMPFPRDYCYRMSGTLIDSLSNSKIVLGSDIPLLKHYNAIYPSICRIVRGVEGVYEALNSPGSSEANRIEFLAFKQAHSEDNIVESIRSIFREK